MKNIKKIIYFFSLLLIVSSCSDRITIPQYVTVEKINSLQNGMSKTVVANKMGVAPFDAYHALESGCELYSYKYVLKDQKIRPEDSDRRAGLKGNQDYFAHPKNVYVYFENNKLVDIITDLGLEYGTDLDAFGNTLESSCDGPISGCTDVEALNYNKGANADDGSCKYCPCDQIKNPDYDSVRKCGDQCISINQSKSTSEEDDCSICDIVKNASSNTTINITTVAPWEGTNQSSRNKTSNSESNSNDKKLASIDNKIAKLNKALSKSKVKDIKKGKVSKKTKLLKKALEKLQTTRNNLK
jgi:hypothetical protein